MLAPCLRLAHIYPSDKLEKLVGLGLTIPTSHSKLEAIVVISACHQLELCVATITVNIHFYDLAARDSCSVSNELAG